MLKLHIEFIHREFLINFRRLFRFRKQRFVFHKDKKGSLSEVDAKKKLEKKHKAEEKVLNKTNKLFMASQKGKEASESSSSSSSEDSDEEQEVLLSKFSHYPFYDFNDGTPYSDFMVKLLESFEVRHFPPGFKIFNSTENPEECYFIRKGRWDVGYEVNNKSKYCLQFGPRTVIGAFNLMFDQRLDYIYRAHTDIEAMALRRRDWLKLEKDF